MTLDSKYKPARVFWILVLVFAVANGSGRNLFDENPKECRVLPSHPKRTSVAGERNVSIVDLLNGGSTEISTMKSSTDAWPSEAILVLGNTGSGKTTLTQILTSDLTRLHAVKTQTGSIVIIDNDERISAPTTVSRTLIPELVTYRNGDNSSMIYFYDCPGFDDTRGPEQDLAANFFMNQIVRNVARVKMLFLVKHSSVQPGHHRLDFDLLAKHASTFVKKMSTFEHSIGLVVTKVNSFNEQGNFLDDLTIQNNIVEFISVYNQTLHDTFYTKSEPHERDMISRKIEFVNILLKPDKIQFYRSPEVCGPLNNSVFVQQARVNVTSLYQSLTYSPVGNHSNFGYTLKDKTKLSIESFTVDINQAITKNVGELMSNLSVWFDKQSALSNGDTGAALNLIRKSISLETSLKGEEMPDTPSQFAAKLTKALSQIQFPVESNFIDFVTQQDDFLAFFDESTGYQVARAVNDWLSPIIKLQEERRIWASEQADNLTSSVNQAILQEIQNTVQMFSEWFDENATLQNDDILAQIQLILQSRSPIQKLGKTVSELPVQLAAEIVEQFEVIGFSASSTFQTFMAEQETHLNTLDELTSSKVFRGVDEWLGPLRELNTNYSAWLTKTSETLVKKINENIAAEVKSLVQDFTTWFDVAKFEQTDNISEIVQELQRCMFEYSKLAVVGKENARQLATVLSNSLVEIGYTIGEAHGNFVANILALKNGLETLDLEIGERVTRDANSWWAPIVQFQEKLQGYITWYNFCLQVSATLSAQTLTNPDQNVGDDGIAYLQLNDILPVTDDLLKLSEEYKTGRGVQHQQVLIRIILWHITPPQIECQVDTLKITGHLISFGSFSLAECQSAKQINVYASDTVFIDRDINAAGQEMQLSLIAPKWEVSSPQRIILDGADALPRSGKTCPNGLPGLPGKPGGSFFGRVGEIVGAHNLEIFVKGGKGGRGQDGCDGANGTDGASHQTKNGESWLVWGQEEVCTNGADGSRGQNGGNGGAGGLGGKSGVVDISEEFLPLIRVLKGAGAEGQGGNGGKGGQGGKGSTTSCKTDRNILRVIEWGDDRVIRHSNGDRGSDGKNGANVIGRVGPADATALNGFGALEEYKSYTEQESNHVTKAFLATLQN